MLETAFWDSFWASASPDLKKKGSKKALSVALRVDVVNRFLVDGGMLDKVNFDNGFSDSRSLDYAKGILMYLRNSTI